MEQNYETGWADNIQEVVLPLPVREEKLSSDDENISETPKHGISSEYA